MPKGNASPTTIWKPIITHTKKLRQIARYLPHHRSENASKTHPKSSHDKFKTASKEVFFHFL